MSVKEALHSLVDRLDEDDAAVALALLTNLLDDHPDGQKPHQPGSSPRHRPPMMSGRDFLAQPPMDWRAMAAEQGVRPLERFENLFGTDVADDETADEIIAAIREWRREDRHA